MIYYAIVCGVCRKFTGLSHPPLSEEEGKRGQALGAIRAVEKPRRPQMDHS